MKEFTLRFTNPLRGLTETRLVSYLELGERGAYAELQWLYRFIEKRNAAARAVKRRLLSSLGALDWDIRTPDIEDDADKKAMADAQAKTLRAAYDRITNLRAALEHLALAEMRGFAHVEKIFDPSATGDLEKMQFPVIELRPVEQWFFVRDGIYSGWQYNENGSPGTFRGTPLDARKWIVREVDDPINEIAAIAHVRQEVSDSDWDGYLDKFGIPSVFIEGPPNVPPEKEAEYQRTAERIASDASGYIPNGAKVTTVTPGTGSTVFQERLDYLDSKIVIAATSGKLTILTESGSGTLAGGAQKDAFDDIAQAIAGKVSEAMQSQFDRAELERMHPGEPVLAYFEFAAVQEEDTAAHIENAVKLGTAGYEIDLTELSEKSGYTITRKAVPGSADTLTTTEHTQGQPPAADSSAATTKPVTEGAPPEPKPEGTDALTAPVAGRDAGEVSDAIARELRVTPEFVAPAKSVIDELLAKAADGSVSNEELIASADDLLKRLPELARNWDRTGLADAMQAGLMAAVEKTLQPNA